jgi:DNA-binding NarL/FixJ family response regulator
MAVTSADVQLQQYSSLRGDCKVKMIRILLVHECPLFRVGLRSFLAQQDDCHLVGEATHLDDVLVLAREHHPDIVLLDGGLTSADPLDLVQQLRQVGVPGIMVFAPPAADEETLFQFLRYGARAYELNTISGEELLAKVRRVALGECLVTSDVLFAQAARRERLARIRQDASPDACLERKRTQDSPCSVSVSGPPLSEEERAILEELAKGRTNAQVAQTLRINPHTVKNRLNGLFRKLNVCDRTAAVMMAIREQWITL